MNRYFMGLIITYMLLAIISRKNYSKYKGCGIMRLFMSMGKTMFGLINKYLPVKRTEEKIRKTGVKSADKIKEEAELFYVQSFAWCLAIVLSFSTIGMLFSIPLEDKNSNRIKRQGFDGKTNNYRLLLEYNNEVIPYELKVERRKLTYEEFCSIADDMFDELGETILNKNQSMDHISYDLMLPLRDEQNIFEISWSSDKPWCISSYGRLQDTAADGEKVRLTATIIYYDYSAYREYDLIVGRMEEKYDWALQMAIDKLVEIEQKDISSEYFDIPDEIGSVKVSVSRETNSDATAVIVFGFFLCILIFVLRGSKLKEKQKNRDNVLIKNYPGFVNYIWLFLGTGMTIRGVLGSYLKGNGSELLKEEIRYTLNTIDSGVDEAAAYEMLGARINIKEYSRLFMHISQNLRMGTKDIRNIMEEEMYVAMETRREHAKRLGEEASTKLLIPMIMMLLVVVLIVVFPALIS